jgi:DNA-binding XRE family transcriptional regulator
MHAPLAERTADQVGMQAPLFVPDRAAAIHWVAIGSAIDQIIDRHEQMAWLLRMARHASHLTQDQLARRAGVGRGVVSRLELGHTSPQARHVYEAAGLHPDFITEMTT